ncbi:hypothetical protein J2X12_002873 [Pseudarthrobacter oxydans]|uniref:Uncharacterized protein n=1 Tax=Pseudarthrobacter oxydans TaxID=1671 RepID=A0AAW8ND82_PSEOX|nr:hypothetical protein [Pseudarthrobacter oxydans]MDR7164835.1 hypothetical protein [Pseudarthrobacter oxydans]
MKRKEEPCPEWARCEICGAASVEANDAKQVAA